MPSTRRSRRTTAPAPGPILLRGLARRALDPPDARSLAWPGAAPIGGTAARQLGLFDILDGTHPVFDEADGVRFDPRAFVVRRIEGKGVSRLRREFLRRHYLGGPGVNGPTLTMHARRSGQLVGIACFGRYPKPRWARDTFRGSREDQRRVRDGEWTPQAYRNRLVRENEYLDLNRLYLLPAHETEAPLGSGTRRESKGAATWFVARCLEYFAERNRSLWLAQTMLERGLALPPALARLLLRAQLHDEVRGLGFVKAVSAMADPRPGVGHVGFIYQLLGMRYYGQSGRGGVESVRVGLRSGEIVSARTIAKARAADDAGHDTAALRLAWEGSSVEVAILRGDQVRHTDDGAWIRSLETPRDRALAEAIAERWATYQAEARARFGAAAEIRVRYLGGGLRTVRVPGKHRYMQGLGAPYWNREVLRRCPLLRPQLEEEEALWDRRGRSGRRPDLRTWYYPRR